MNRPGFTTMLVGHPLVVLPVMGSGAFGIYAFVQDAKVWPAALVVGLIMAKVMQACEAAEAYKRWKRQWDAMGGGEQRPKRSLKKVMAVALGIAAIFGLIVIADSNGASAATGIAMLIGGPVLCFATLAKLWRWSRRRRPAAKATPVAVCVTKPLMAVPDMRTAYRGLPEHCLRVLRTTR